MNQASGVIEGRAMAPFDLDACIAQLLRKQLLHEALLREICEKTNQRSAHARVQCGPCQRTGDSGWGHSWTIRAHR